MNSKRPQILAVISSPNREGNSASLCRRALEGAAAAGADVEECFLSDYRIGFCRACNQCLLTGSCPVGDDFGEVLAALRRADGIILSSPVYGGTINARMKNLLDRLGMFEYITSATFGGKYVAAIVTARRKGTAHKVARYLADLPSKGVFARAYVSGSLGAVAAPAGQPPASEGLAAAESLGRRLAEAVQGHATFPAQGLAARALTKLVVRPQMSAAIVSHREGFMRGVYLNLNQRGLLS